MKHKSLEINLQPFNYFFLFYLKQDGFTCQSPFPFPAPHQPLFFKWEIREDLTTHKDIKVGPNCKKKNKPLLSKFFVPIIFLLRLRL